SAFSLRSPCSRAMPISREIFGRSSLRRLSSSRISCAPRGVIGTFSMAFEEVGNGGVAARRPSNGVEWFGRWRERRSEDPPREVAPEDESPGGTPEEDLATLRELRLAPAPALR